MRKITRVTLFIPKVKRNVAKVKRLIALKIAFVLKNVVISQKYPYRNLSRNDPVISS